MNRVTSIYRYTGRNNEGKSVKGMYKAESESDVAAMLRAKGIYPVTIKKEETGDILEILKNLTKKAKPKDLAVYCRQFSAVIGAGIPIVKSLEILQLQGISPVLVKATQNAREDIISGLSLGQAFRNNADVFPEIFVNMVEAGEISGSLNNALERLAEHFERENDIINKVKSATTYPIILSSTAIVVVILIVTKVLPIFAGMFESYGAALPIPTRILLVISDFLSRFFWILVLALVLAFLLFIKIRSTPEGRLLLEKIYYNIPFFGPIVTKLILARFSRTLSTMILNGIPLLDAVDTMNRVIESETLKIECNKIKESIQKGAGISEAAASGNFFPPLFVEMTAIGEETGSLTEMLNKIADYYDREVKDVLNRLSTILEPMIIVVMAVVIGFIVISIILPMFEMMRFVG
ncbi:MAG: type II secretion system F family protein [Tepidanaerobacteraceae bacterium]